jgi:hypothetical protein
MRIPAVAVILLGISGLSPATLGQTTPNVLISGQVESALAYGQTGWCAVAQGSSAVQRNQAAPVAVISFPELTYFDGATYYPLNGQARLTFSSPSRGRIHFKNTRFGSSISNPRFENFSETFNGTEYVIRFLIAFPNNCTLSISADFEAP